MLKEKLFYWEYDGSIRFSKTKFFSILIFLYVFISRMYYSKDFLIAISVAGITALVAFVIGYFIHNSVNTTSIGSSGLIGDIIHLFFYWEDSGKFVLSKTKIISIIVYFIAFIYCCLTSESYYVFANLGVALFFGVFTFLLGYFIHIGNKNGSPNETIYNGPRNDVIKEEPVAEVLKNEPANIEENNGGFNVPKFNNYSHQINNLKDEFNNKDEKARQLVEKAFQPPQLTYDNFISYLDKSKNLFNDQIDVIETIFDLATEDSNRLDEEIEGRINILKLIIEKIDLLNNELVLFIGKSKSDDEDINYLLDEMESLINSVKNYD